MRKRVGKLLQMGILEGYCDLTMMYCSYCQLLLALAALLAMIVCLGMVEKCPKKGRSNKLQEIAIGEKGWEETQLLKARSVVSELSMIVSGWLKETWRVR